MWRTSCGRRTPDGSEAKVFATALANLLERVVQTRNEPFGFRRDPRRTPSSSLRRGPGNKCFSGGQEARTPAPEVVSSSKRNRR